MKRMLCILCSALLFAACTSQPVQNAQPTEEPAQMTFIPAPEIAGYTDFSDALSAKVLDGTKNQNLSPISVYLALAMVAEGAKGETKVDLLHLLGCDSSEMLRAVCGAMLASLSIDTEDSTLAVADSIWMADRDGLSFREDYLKTLADIYRSEANTVRFGTKEASEQIADWIRVHTHDKITLPPDATDFDADTIAVLINTIYLKDAWRVPFYAGATESGTFFGPNGEQTVNYMSRKDYGSAIVKGDGYLRYSLPLLRVGRMSFVLPDEGTELSELLGSPDKLHALLTEGESQAANVSVLLPKFKFEDRIELNEVLGSLGIERAFSEYADFSAMCDRHVQISEAMQGSFIGVDEIGVEAAAYTLIAMDESMPDPSAFPDVDFHLTRPFLYAIESYDGTVLFIGTVAAPTPAEG